MKSRLRLAAPLLFLTLVGPAGAASDETAQLAEQARAIFGPLPATAPRTGDLANDARLTLGRLLYFDARLSKNHDVSCNSCHGLDTAGVDGDAVSTGHRGQKGGRNAPTVYNAALHVAQFWDGRAADVEAQALGPPLNPIEMAMPNGEAVEAVLASIPGYVELFAEAFPGEEPPLSYVNMGRAIGAFERTLLTPSSFDDFMSGDLDALTPAQLAGLRTFLSKGCITCHNGAAVGGAQYQKLGLVNPYSTNDIGREAVTNDELDRFVFKVPSLRNVTRTGPWFHDGVVGSLPEAVRLMAWHQLGIKLSGEEVASIVEFLGSLDGRIPDEWLVAPELPASGPETPAPDPT
jgi:cytochrome c peroxidase